MNVIFGPVNSRRFGKSLGVDLSPSKKQCNFDCLYCELPAAKTMDSYEDVISVEEIVNAVQSALEEHKDIDVLTITANGEPTLYPHLSELMNEINGIKGRTQTLI
ncbi:MAG TPA: radical SAM protein, partial [Campylobacterales bacterium]|nr:radical SAM protein [Campylobacterales bacterium]